jgi:hypothetical protein
MEEAISDSDKSNLSKHYYENTKKETTSDQER